MQQLTKMVEETLKRYLQVDDMAVQCQNYTGQTEVVVSFHLGQMRQFSGAEVDELVSKFLKQIYESELNDDLKKKISELENLHEKIEEIHEFVVDNNKDV